MNASSISAATIVIEGRVQGVGFRAYAFRVAREIGLVGTVSNAPDGTVIVNVEGTRDAIEHLYMLLKHGPPHAIVKQAIITWHTPTGCYSDFRIVA